MEFDIKGLEDCSYNEKVLQKKLHDLQCLKEAMEKGKPLLSVSCCHRLNRGSYKRENVVGKMRHSAASERIQNRYQAARLAEEVKEAAKVKRQIEIIQRLLNEERRKQRDKKMTGYKKKVSLFPPIQKTSVHLLEIHEPSSMGGESEEISEEGEAEEEETITVEEEQKVVEETKPKSKKDKVKSAESEKSEKKGKGKSKKSEPPVEEVKEPPPPPPPPKSVVPELLNNFDEWASYRHVEEPKFEVPIDACFSAHPTEVIFQFQRDKKQAVYKQKLSITNTGLTDAFCGFDHILLEDTTHKIIVKPSDIEYLRTGLSFTIQLQLFPGEQSLKAVSGRIVFMTRRGESRGRFLVPIKYISNEELIKSVLNQVKVIRFKKVKYWERTKTKPLVIVNPTEYECFVIINEIKEPGSGRASEESLISTKTINREGPSSLKKLSNKSLSKKSTKFDEGVRSPNQEVSGKPAEYEEGGKRSSRKSSERRSSLKRSSSGRKLRRSGSATKSASFSKLLEDSERSKNLMMRSIIEKAIAKVFEPILLMPQYFCEIPPNGTTSVMVNFRPYVVGCEDSVQTKYKAVLVADGSIVGVYDIIVYGETEDIPLKVSPIILDMQLCVIGAGIQQKSFSLQNLDQRAWQLSINATSDMNKHISIVPKKLYIQSRSVMPVLVQFHLKSGFEHVIKRYTQEGTGITEFPIFINPVERKCQKLFPVILPVIFAVTSCFGLTVSPTDIDFGIVNTTECAKAQIQLTNHSLATQHYCFLNIPNTVNIQPGNGCGQILPEETQTLDILYTPHFSQVACCKAHTGVDNFKLIVITSFSAFGLKKIVQYSETVPEQFLQYVDLTTISPENEEGMLEEGIEEEEEEETVNNLFGSEALENNVSGLTPVKHENESNRNAEEETVSQNEESFESESLAEQEVPDEMLQAEFGVCESRIKETDVPIERHTEIGASVDEDEEEKSISSDNSAANIDLESVQRFSVHSNYVPPGITRGILINCLAIITDPYLEFSSEKVLLHQTPCNSTSKASVILRERREEICMCSKKIIHHPFKGFFEMETDCPALNVQPRRGTIQNGQEIKVFFIYSPRLKNKHINEKAKEIRQLKVEKHLQEAEQLKAAGKAESSKGKKSEKKTTKTTKAPKEPPFPTEVIDEDIEEAKVELLKYMEAKTITATVTCRTQLNLKANNTQLTFKNEVIECHIVCQKVKPDFIAMLPSPPVIDFGKIPVGTRTTILVPIQNISTNNIYVNTSQLDPLGPFFCPLVTFNDSPYHTTVIRKQIAKRNFGVFLEPEQLFNMMLHFRPKSANEDWEMLEVKANRTLIAFKITGCGVEPGVTINPNTTLFQMEAVPGATNTITISITSTCDAVQNFKLSKEFVKTIEAASIAIQTETNKPPTDKKSAKPSKKTEVLVLDERLRKCLEENGTAIQEDDDRYKVFNLATPKNETTFCLEPKQKVAINLKYSPGVVQQNDQSQTPTPTKKGNKTKEGVSTANENQTSNVDVAKFNLSLGGLVTMQEWFCLGKIKQKK